MTDKPAQSDAPSAEEFLWKEFSMVSESIAHMCEAYAALRTAQLTGQVASWRNEFREMVKIRDEFAAKVAQLGRERAAFIERTRIAEADKSAAESALSEARERVQKTLAFAESQKEGAQTMLDGEPTGNPTLWTQQLKFVQHFIALLAGASGAAGKGEDNG